MKNNKQDKIMYLVREIYSREGIAKNLLDLLGFPKQSVIKDIIDLYPEELETVLICFTLPDDPNIYGLKVGQKFSGEFCLNLSTIFMQSRLVFGNPLSINYFKKKNRGEK